MISLVEGANVLIGQVPAIQEQYFVKSTDNEQYHSTGKGQTNICSTFSTALTFIDNWNAATDTKITKLK